MRTARFLVDRIPNDLFLSHSGLERARLRYMIRSLGGKYSGHLTKWHTHLVARESDKSDKFKKALIWSISIVNGLWLSELFLGNTYALQEPLDERYKRLSGTPVIDHFSFDQIFVHDLLSPWSQPIRVTDEMLNSGIRRHHEQLSSHSHDLDTSNTVDYFKNCFHYNQPLDASLTPVIPIDEGSFSIMLSGFNASTSNHYETIIKSLGGQISSLPHSTTHFIMNRFVRTEKFYECLGYVTYVLNRTWLDRCHEEKRFLPIEECDWLLNEESNPAPSSFQQTIEKRVDRQNRPLFLGYTFFLTPSIRPSQATMQSIIHATGGSIRRSFPTLKQLTVASDSQPNVPQCIILSCDSDKFLLQDLHKYNNTELEIKLLSTDFILESIVQQEILNIDSFLLKI